MKNFRLPEDTHIQSIALKVEEKEELIAFYKNQLGFVLKSEENNLSILGSKKKRSRLIILEQKIEDEKPKRRIPIRYSLLIPTEEEFFCIAKRIFETDYPINELYRDETCQMICLSDPEENQIDIVCKEIKDSTLGKLKEKIALEKIAEKSTADIPQLTPEVTIYQVYLPVVNEESSVAFYEQMLGMIHEEECLAVNQGEVTFHLNELGNDFSIEAADHTVGINFYVLNVNDSKAIEKLEKHLEQNHLEFFVDKKKTILSVFDPNGIEWWFVRK